MVAFTYGAAAVARSEVGTGTGMTAALSFGGHFLCWDTNFGLRYDEIEFDDDTLRRLTLGNQDFYPSGEKDWTHGYVLVYGFSGNWSESGAWGVGPVLGTGGYLGHYRRLVVTGYGTLRFSLGSDGEDFDAAAEASALIEATVMF